MNFSTNHKYFLAIILISALLADTMLSNISDITKDYFGNILGSSIFVVLVLMIYSSAYFLFLGYSRKINFPGIWKSKDLHLLDRIVTSSSYILTVIVVILTMQMILLSKYNVLFLVIITLIGYLLSAVILGLLAYHMYLWYRKNKRNFMLLFFVLSSAMTATAVMNSGISQAGLTLSLNMLIVGTNTDVTYPSLNSSTNQILADIYSISLIQSMLAYGLTWCAICFLIYNYSKKIGLKKYMIVISLPMGSFIVGITPILLQLPITSSYFDPSLLIFRIISISALLSVGILFGISFLTTIKSLRSYTKNTITEYLFISAIGIASLFIALAANIAYGSFPPFGIASYGFTAFGSYFYLLGIYSSAIKISSDTELRKIIQKYLMQQGKFLASIGGAQLENQLEDNAFRISKEHSERFASTSGIRPEIPPDEVKAYIQKLLIEIKTNNKKQ